jgi:Tol biopolymer transport system component
VKRAGTILAATAAVLAAAASAGADPTRTRGTIVFSSSRAAASALPAVYTIGVDGRGRRRVTPKWAGLSSPRWSPSGNWIAFLRGQALYVVPANGGKPRRIARRYAVKRPEWSPDGSRLAFVAERREGVDLMVMETGRWRPQQRARNVHSRPAWSPDSREIAYAGPTGRLLAVDVTTGARRRLPNGRVPVSAPAWSPDGTRIAFGYAFPADGTYEIFVSDLRTWRVRRIARNMQFPAWSPDGSLLAVKSSSYVYVMDPRGRRRVRVSHEDIDESPSDPAVWSPDSKRLAVTEQEVYVVRASGGRRRRVTGERPRFRVPFLEEASWSPDGRRLAYVSEKYDPGDRDLYTISAAGGAPRALTANWVDERLPVWSPDGTAVAYAQRRRHRSFLAVLPARGRARVLVPGEDPAWAPDGTKLVFARGGDLFVVSPDGSGERRVTTGPQVDADPDWSPDGRQLVFERPNAQGYWELWAVFLDGTGLRRLTDVRRGRGICTVTGAHDPAWSPDGSEIAFALLDGGSLACGLHGVWWSVHAVAADGSGDTRLVTDGGRVDATGGDGATAPAWSPDGTELAFVTQNQTGTRIAVVQRQGGPFRYVTSGRYKAFDPDWRLP